jgi:hypothetical protein
MENMPDEQDKKSTVKYRKTMTSVSSVVAVGALLWGLNERQNVSALTAELNSAHSTNQSLVNEANAKLHALSKHDLPVNVSFHPALLGNGLVATFKNNSGNQLEVAAVFISESTGQTKETNLVLPASDTQEIGYAQGWAFAKGQHVKLSNGNFRPAEYVVP